MVFLLLFVHDSRLSGKSDVYENEVSLEMESGEHDTKKDDSLSSTIERTNSFKKWKFKSWEIKISNAIRF
ncbi:hypothetical protein KL925_001882 [Ogataea polymorpha]|nr:hypothetical protein KL937_000555 [Ogataea polymorpha]KAG7891936.1 hypothetical protein KL936_001879 [Ogataea polymorpha]KAG7895289.1 hypothetical protein KL908_001639 [Ogataea polymorpha]KAG7911783.1 hypothetical protein KL906_001104 [Ogataea polymorpha]KAG7928582.1 hypothetical protein KL925_001882 [Ogataea polymorpha]